MALTVTGAVVSMEFIEIRALETLMIPVKGSHHSRPRLTEHKVAFALALDQVAVLVQDFWQNAKERERLSRIRDYTNFTV